MKRTKEEIEAYRQGVEWKANLYAVMDEVIRCADAGDPLCMRVLARVGLCKPPRLVTPEPPQTVAG